jgi:hypothetical protein
VIVTLVPGLLGLDERAHAALPYLMNGLTDGLAPIEVRRTDGSPLPGEVMVQINRTKDGWLVLLLNNNGVGKTQNGVARVDRRAFVDVLLRTTPPVQLVREYTGPRDLAPEMGKEGTEVHVRVQPGDVQMEYFTVK